MSEVSDTSGTTPTTEAESTVRALMCSTCGQGLDWCSFCDREDCPAALCYECVAVALRQVMKHPHAHGG